MLISIDHGNKQIKTVHKTFTSGLCESETRPPFGQDVLSLSLIHIFRRLARGWKTFTYGMQRTKRKSASTRSSGTI